MGGRNVIKYVIAVVFLVLVGMIPLIFVSGSQTKTVYLKDGGNGDGSSYEQAMGDFKAAVRSLVQSGGRIVICGKYTYNELINLSPLSGTSNGDKVITVTCTDGNIDYRETDNAMLCVGDENGSANMILAGKFVFENLNIVTGGSDKSRAIICGGYDTVFGEGIVCKKQGKAPYLSIVGVSLGETRSYSGSSLVIKSGSYLNVCAGNRDGNLTGNTSLSIDGGTFDGTVSATGFADVSGMQKGNASLVINGGTFTGMVGTYSPNDGDFALTINGGIFRKEISALGRYNYVDVNGGNLQNVVRLNVADFIEQPPETTEDGEVVETKEEDVKRTSVNINSYSGDVKKLVEKIRGTGFEIKVNTEGGNDVETTAPLETRDNTSETDNARTMETAETLTPETVEPKTERTYLLGTKKRTVIAILGIGAVMALAVVGLAYRSVYRKK